MAGRGPVVQVRGLRELRTTLRKAGTDMGEQMKPAFLQAGGIAAAEARRRVPVRTGALRDTIGPGATKRGAVIRAGFKATPYAGPIHWGWRKHNIKPTYFVSDAAQATEPQWIGVIFRAVDDVLDSIKGD